MGWSRVGNPAEVVRPGDAITVKVLRVEDGGKIALGLKQLQADPWSTVAEKYKVGQVLPGKVTRIADFGAFIELEPGVEALAHESSFEATGKRDAWKTAVAPGAAVTVEIVSLDLERKRIGVALRAEPPEPVERVEQEQGGGFGSLADKLRAAMKPAKE
jgi:small subunit ribosomal protein S1